MGRMVGVVVVSVVFSGCLFGGGCAFFPPGPDPRVRLPDAGPCFEFTQDEVDFGETPVGARRVTLLGVTNRMPFDLVLSAQAFAPFSVTPTSLHLPPGGVESVTVAVEPDDGEAHVDAVLFEDPSVIGGCALPFRVRALGGGKLTFDDALDFPHVTPGQSLEREFHFTNSSRAPIAVTNFSISGAVFDALLPATLMVPPRGTASVTVRATPTDLAVFTGTLSFRAPDGVHTQRLQVVGGQPRAVLTSTRVDFGHAALFVGSTMTTFRHLRLSNTGLSGPVRETQLRLVAPVMALESLLGPPELELTVDVSRALDPLPTGASAPIDLTFTPTSLGPRHWRLTLFTNDPLQPGQVVDVVAEVSTPAPCTVTTAPTSGEGLLLVTEPDAGVARGELVFTNASGNPCTLDDVRLDDSSTSAFSLELGGTEQVTLPSGGTHRVVVVARSTGGVVARGALRYQVLAPQETPRLVQLGATVP